MTGKKIRALICLMVMGIVGIRFCCRPVQVKAASQTDENTGVQLWAEWAGIHLTIPEGYVWEQEQLRFARYDEDGNLRMEIAGVICDSSYEDWEYRERLDTAQEEKVKGKTEEGFSVFSVTE